MNRLTCIDIKEVLKMKIDKEYVKKCVEKGLATQFEIYSWETMIHDIGLTDKEAKWAREHLTYAVKEV